MKKLLVLVVAVFAFSQNVVDINLNNTDVEAGYEHIKRFSKNTKIYSSIHYLSGEDKWDKKNWLLDARTTVVGLTDIPGFSVGIGGKAIFTRVEHRNSNDWDFLGLGIQADILYTLPVRVKTLFHFLYVYGPESLAFLDLHNFYEMRLQFDVEIIDGAMIYAGYRDIEMKAKKHTKEYYEFNKDVYVGVKFVF